jgi:predicted enzyme related to lactoylglutathione lyase
MQVQSMDLAWIVVKDLKKAIQFYTEVMGLKLLEMHEEFGWAELKGHKGGSRLGIAQMDNTLQAGDNACVTMTVDNLEKAKELLEKKGVKCIGKLQEIPGHVKLQMVVDNDGNHMQLVEDIHSA